VARRRVEQGTWRHSVRDSDGVEAVGCHLSKVRLDRWKILVLLPLTIWAKCSVSYAFDVELLIPREQEFSLGLQARLCRDHFDFRRDVRNSRKDAWDASLHMAVYPRLLTVGSRINRRRSHAFIRCDTHAISGFTLLFLLLGTAALAPGHAHAALTVISL